MKMALTWAGVITILFLAAACVRAHEGGLVKLILVEVLPQVYSRKYINL